MEQNGTSTTLSNALMTNMRPSFIRWVLDVCFPHVDKSSHLPDDVLLVLTLLQTRSVQLTSLRNETPLIQTTTSLLEDASSDDGSSISETSSTDSEDSTESGSAREQSTLFEDILGTVMSYTFNNGDCKKHEDIDRAAISALQGVVESDEFGTSTVIGLTYEAAIVETLFDGLNRRLEFTGHTDRDPSWLTPTLFHKLWHILTAFIESGEVHDGWRAVGYVLNYVVQFPSQLQAAEAIYGYLIQHDWLHDIGLSFSRFSPRQIRSPTACFLVSGVLDTYMLQRRGRALYRPFEDLTSLIKALAADVECSHFTPPMYPKVNAQLTTHSDTEAQISPRKQGNYSVLRRDCQHQTIVSKWS
ncbi:hypothetical protein BDZ89DRAFT_1040771 [Hymenopellis radicata]|nr:hypothetical protein BDZ89DRAFT_1040771 [Hymenopellis radicata]